MVARDKDDRRNREEGESGPGGVRMVVEADLMNEDALGWFWDQMNEPGSPMFEELSKMEVGRAEEVSRRIYWTLGHRSS
jgi:hypothetical protein